MVKAICKFSGVQFMFDSPPMGEAIHEAVHPHVYMPLSTARSVLLRLSQSKNITLQLEGTYPLLVQLRLCTLRVLLEIDALVSNYCCDAVVALPDDADQAALLHVINVDSMAALVLLDKYKAGGMPRLAVLELGCAERLLRSCIELLRDAILDESTLAQIGFDSSVSYQLRTTTQVQPSVFIGTLSTIAPGLSNHLVTLLYHMHLLAKLRTHAAGITSSESEGMVAMADTSIYEFEAVLELPRIVRGANVDLAVAEAVLVAATEYRRTFNAQYDRLLAQVLTAKPVSRGLPPRTLTLRRNPNGS